MTTPTTTTMPSDDEMTANATMQHTDTANNTDTDNNSDNENDRSTDSTSSLPPLRVPTVADHIGHGIRPGDFIKPDPHDARATQRRHITDELHTWLTERIFGAARLASHTDMTQDEIRAAMEEGRGWPGGRLWLLLQTLDADEIPLPGEPADTCDRLRLTGEWAAAVCENWLKYGENPEWTAERLALGFVTEDRLLDGRTIADLWPSPSDLDALRDAPPLPESDGDADAEDTPTSPSPLLQMRVHVTNTTGSTGNPKFMDTAVTVTTTICLPAWVWVALFLTVVFYFWVVAFMVGGQARLMRHAV